MKRTTRNMFPIMEQYEKGMQSRQELCKKHGINDGVFWYWLGKYRTQDKQNGSFIPVQLKREGPSGFAMEMQIGQGILIRFSELVPAEYIHSIMERK